ncbi:MAG TPA: GAF domain-containing protein, partial [Steroidobacteraceae bacterium]|nr:GAF domain-containing protein [Steroidobacteraceae bacterium]
MHAKVARTGEPAVRTDAENDPDLLPEGREMARARGYRSDLVVPMLQEAAVIGAISVTRSEPGDFGEHQVSLLKTFADQAVIAIENVRLFNETKEALERQTATAEILKVIAGSPTDVQPVFEVIVQSAVRLCGARFGRVYRYDGSIIEMVAGHGLSAKWMNQVRQVFPRPASDDTIAGRVILTRRPFFLNDIQTDQSVPELSRKMIEALDTRSQVTVPMLRGGEAIGAITMGWEAPGAFDDQQVALLQTFADQAVIAIENVRLFDEVQGRTRELAASLEDLRATQDRLVQTQKLASLGQLTAGIAHEIKNPLNFVNNFSTVSSELVDELQDTLEGLSVDDKTRKQIDELTTMLRGNLDKVVQHGKRADSIVKNMLLHSREGSGEHRLVDINALVEESLNLAYHGARAETQGFNVTLERALDP